MNTKGLMAGISLAILILTTSGAALDAPFNSAFSTVYGQVTDGGAGVNGADVSLTANGMTITTKTMTNNRGENGFYIFELANIPDLADTTPMTLTVTTGTKTATTTITRGGNDIQKVDLVPQTPGLTTITVTPATATLAVGGTQTFTATDQNGNPVSVTWSSSNNTVGTIDAAGEFTAAAAGTTTVSAANGSIVGTASVTVTGGWGGGGPAASITGFSTGNGNRGSWINASVNITNPGAAPQTFVIVVSGVSPQGYPLAGTGTLTLAAGQSMNNVPVLVTIPPVTPVGDYSLLAGVWKLEEYPDPERLIMARGPATAVVS